MIRAACLLAIAACAGDDIPPPHIGSITPAAATAGAAVSITGAGFCHQPPTEEPDPFACDLVGGIVFGSTPANTSLYEDLEIDAEVPALPAGVVSVTVVVGGRSSNAVDFTVE